MHGRISWTIPQSRYVSTIVKRALLIPSDRSPNFMGIRMVDPDSLLWRAGNTPLPHPLERELPAEPLLVTADDDVQGQTLRSK